ncbi:MAG: quinolinate synthase NadA, partial [Firmicutes bacterium]|nr:quinolinate synthase NadA [Bacillota bacterium]
MRGAREGSGPKTGRQTFLEGREKDGQGEPVDPGVIVDRLKELREARNAVILAHNYQLPQIQDAADYVGDSLGLSRQAAATGADVIVFCGVHFMAETASILCPDKTVLLPARNAGCPLAEKADVPELLEMKAKYPGARVVAYVNSSARVKAESDVCCTSGNAVKVVEAQEARQVIFLPDRNLAHWVSKQTSKEIIPWPGFCITHQRVGVEDVSRAREAHPEALVVVHPECRPEVVELADWVASTDGILRYCREKNALKFIIGTEMGLIHRLKKENPGKSFFLLSPGLVCPNMKKTSSLEMVVRALERMEPRITVPEDVRLRAL